MRALTREQAQREFRRRAKLYAKQPPGLTEERRRAFATVELERLRREAGLSDSTPVYDKPSPDSK